jgi:spore germination protein YaaH
MDPEALLSTKDRALLDEAARRVEAARHRNGADRTAVMSAMASALIGGRRDLFGLVKAGQRAR